MRILVRMPNWIGDAVMATPALANLARHHPEAPLVLVGSSAVAELLRGDPRFAAVIADPTRGRRARTLRLAWFARQLRRSHGPFDLGVALTNNFSSRWLLYAAGSRKSVGRKWGPADALLHRAVRCDAAAHQVEVYNEIVDGALGTQTAAGRMRLVLRRPHRFAHPTAGINPGAAYGSAKRWPAERFAEVAAGLAQAFDIVILGGRNEQDIAGEIAADLRQRGIRNVRNVAGNTLRESVRLIGGLQLLVTNDSGPMHVATALRVPLVAIFGSTDERQSRPWRHEAARVIRKQLPCAPCHQRTCPLGHHACMREVSAEEVLAAAWELIRRDRRAAAG